MTRDPFVDPAESGGIKWEPLKGQLLLIIPECVEENVKTVHGDKNAVKGDVHVLDGSDAGAEYLATLIFPAKLQGQLSPLLGKQVIGRLGQGNAKPGQNAPWQLEKPTDADRKAGMRWLAGQLDDPDDDGGTPPF